MYPQDADLYGNEDLKYVIAHPTGHTGVYPVVEGNDIAGVRQEWILRKLSKLMSLESVLSLKMALDTKILVNLSV